MFDKKTFAFKDSWEEAKELKKVKKLLFNHSKSEFSDLSTFRLKYYKCVNTLLHNDLLEGKNLDKGIVQCKTKLKHVENYINEINQHAKIKVNRCINSKREWARKFNHDLRSEELGVWDCLNRYHRRYLYYYPGIRDTKYV